jgi:hypothetical protein
VITWRKSSYTGGGSDEACVELAKLSGEVWVRDSKDPAGGRLEFERSVFAGLLVRVKRGDGLSP